jgi:hypothetical protein
VRIETESSFAFMVRLFVSLRRLVRSLRKARSCMDGQHIRSLRSADATAQRAAREFSSRVPRQLEARPRCAQRKANYREYSDAPLGDWLGIPRNKSRRGNPILVSILELKHLSSASGVYSLDSPRRERFARLTHDGKDHRTMALPYLQF